MIRHVRMCSIMVAIAMTAGCGGSAEPKLKAVEPPDTPVRKSDVPNDVKHKGSSGAMKKNPAADS